MAALAIVLASPARAQAGVQPEENRVADILQSALVAHGAEVNRCFERALADTLDVSGKIELSVDVGAAGKITKAEPALDEVKSPVLLACLEASALTWSLVGIRSRHSCVSGLNHVVTGSRSTTWTSAGRCSRSSKPTARPISRAVSSRPGRSVTATTAISWSSASGATP